MTRNPTIKALILVITAVFWHQTSMAAPETGKSAFTFTLYDMEQKAYGLKENSDHPMIILYFFDAASRSSIDGLIMLDGLAKKYKDADLFVWGITTSARDKVTAFVKDHAPVFPILMDIDAKVSEMYDARLILPTVCILGPGLTVLDYLQGGGKSTEIMLSRLAERKLMQNETALAKAISSSVEKRDPHNHENIAVKGYAALKSGNDTEAETIFRNLAKEAGHGRVLGLEGLAAVYTAQGQTNKAMELISEIEKIAPRRSYVNVLKGNILYAQNNKKEAVDQFKKATAKKEGTTFQKAQAFNQLGRVYANQKEYEKARKLYDQAIDIDPYYVEATSNKGLTYEKEGRWDTALELYKKAQHLDKSSDVAHVLAEKAAEMLTFQKNVENRKRVDALVKDLAARYRKQQKETPKNQDTWTSRPLILTFADLEEKGSLAQADGYGMVVLSRLSDMLNASGRVRVVERMVIDRLLDELNLGASALADQETALKIGNLLAAKIIGTGTLLHMPKGALLNLRLIDTETTALARVLTEDMGRTHSLEADVNRLNREILKTVIDRYPIKGFVVRAESTTGLINVGANQGVVPGTVFNVIEETPPVEYKGRLLKGSPRVVGEIKVTQVEPDFSHVAVITQKRDLVQDDKIQEKRTVN